MNTIKKLLLITITLTFSFSCATAEVQENKPKQYRVSSFSLFDGLENLIQTVSINYGENNKPIEVITTGSNGVLYNKKTMEYTDSGKISFLKNSPVDSVFVKTEYFYSESDYLVEVISTNEKGSILGSNYYINDERGNPVEWVSESSGNKEKIHFVMEYDENNRILKSSELDNSGTVIYYSGSEYDGMGNETSYTIFTPEGEIDQQLISFYQKSELVRTEVRDEKGYILFQTVYELNNFGKPFKISSYNHYGDLTEWSEMEYDENLNEIINFSYDFEGTLKELVTKKYDENNNLTDLIIYNSDNEIISITKNEYTSAPLNMEDEEFNTLVFKL